MIDYIQLLKNISKSYNVSELVAKVLNDERLIDWSGAGSDKHHHYGDGGLLKHTVEVVEYCQLIAAKHNGDSIGYDNKINFPELLVSAIWHDYGKIWDYQKVDGVWGKHDNHARRIHHISRSALEFEKHYENLCLYHDCDDIPGCNKDNVIHNILAHHGSREWGSPVSPATREAWVLHLADNLSARLDDCYKYDKFK